MHNYSADLERSYKDLRKIVGKCLVGVYLGLAPPPPL